MKKIYTLSVASILLMHFCLQLAAQCTGGRYHDLSFPGNPVVTSDVVYGNNTDWQGNNYVLKLDIYQPACDNVTNRPLIVFAHGGSFVSGDKADAGYVATATGLAKLGYVVASINYRLGFPQSGLDAAYGFNSAIMRGVHDARAAVRFLRNNALNGGNTYGIDANNIYFGGVSAGGIIALHLAYQNLQSEHNMSCNNQPGSECSSIEGTSNNINVSSSVKAIISISGGIRDLNWITTNDIPVYMAHGTLDGTVPYGSGTFGGFFTVHGSSSIATRCNTTSTKYCLTPMINQDHVPSNTAYADTIATCMRNFLEHMNCGVALNCNYTSSPAVVAPSVSITVTAGTNPTCAGTSVTFTATALNGGNTPTYQWKKNNTNIGTGSTYSSAVLANGDVINCVMTPTAGCGLGNPATSNSITMTVNTSGAPTVTIAVTSGTNPSCEGESVTLTATPANGGTSPTYQWKKNGTPAGTNNNTYTSTSFANNDVITCVLTSNSACANPATATSNVVTLTVSVLPIVAQNGNVLTASASTSYQWYKNGQLISGATSQTYTATSTGTYTVVAGATGCESNQVNVVVSGLADEAGSSKFFSIYPNPNEGNFTLTFDAKEKNNYRLEIKNVLGETLQSEILTGFSGKFSKQIDLTKQAKGVYLISISDGKNALMTKTLVN